MSEGHICGMSYALDFSWRVSASGQVMALRLLGRKGFAAYVPHSRLLVVLVVFLQVPSVLKTPGGDLA